MNLTTWEIIQLGGIPMYIIIGFSVLAVAVGLERVFALWAYMDKARNLADTVERCLTRGAFAEGRTACERSQSPLADVFLVGYERVGRVSVGHMAAAVHRERIKITQDLKKFVWILGTIGVTSPFIGLAGTVLGVIGAFGDIAAAEGKGGFAVVSASIAEALYVTFAGIAVAVEAVVIFNFLNQRMARMSTELRMLTEEFLEVLVEHEAEAPGKKARGTSKSDEEADDGNG